MKTKLLAIAVTTIFAACNSNPKTNTETSTTTSVDSAGFRNNAAADRGQVIELKGVNDTIVTGDGSRYVKVDPNDAQKQNLAASNTPEPAVNVPRTTTHSRATAHHRSSGRRSSGGYSGRGSSGGYSGAGSETSNAPVAQRKRGWSKAAKGAVIGAGTGAVAGAIISKKKGLGAVIGGVVGGAGGYIIGRSKDKKDGRY